ncbi:MAG TPA: PKD domain-containing protein [Thermoanaerobaculia bacterium]
MPRTIFASLLLLLFAFTAVADDWRVAHWNVMHGWGRYWNQPGQDATPWPPTGPFSAISDDGGGPNGLTYGQPTGEPNGGCGAAPYLATWHLGTNGPIQTFLRSADLGADPLLVALTMSEALFCIDIPGVKNQLAAGHSAWNTTGQYVQSDRDVIIARYGWASASAPSMSAWDPNTNPNGDMVEIYCRDTKYRAVHAYIFTDAARTPANAIHLFATRLKGDHTCETQRLDQFVRARAGNSGRILVMGDYNFDKSSSRYADLVGRNYIEAGTSPLLPAGSDKNTLTCCFGTSDGLSNGRVHSSRIDMGFQDNLPYATSYWVGNKSISAPDEVAMSDHAVVKIGFTETGPVTDPVIDTPLTATPNPGTVGQAVTLSVQAHDPDAGDTLSYAWSFGDGTSATTTTGSVQHTYAAAGTVTAKVTITDGRGGLASSTASVTINPGGGTCAAPPSPWTRTDVGSGVNGTTCYAGGTFSMTAGGSDLWSTADDFHFVHQTLTGDGEIVANVANIVNPGGAAFSLAAVMMRASLTSSSAHASMMITNSGKAKFRRRLATGGDTVSTGPSEGTTLPPRYLRLKRAGNVFSAYLSTDGVAWSEVAGSPETIALPPTVYVGLVALRNGSTAPAATVTIDHVSVQAAGSAWQSADVGNVGLTGSQTQTGPASFTITAGGDDVWAGADAFRFVYQPMSGDGEISAFIDGLTLPAGAAFSLGGVMIRADLSASSMHATMMATTQNKAKFRRRVTTGATTTLSDGPSEGTQPYRTWVRVKRVGDTFTAWLSSDGVNWTQTGPSQVIAMPANTLVGLVALRNGASAGTMTGTFTNVSVVP